MKGRLALVTGGARRIGKAICIELANAGAQVAIHCFRSRKEADALAQSLGGGSFVVEADFRNGQQMETMMNDVQAQAGKGKIDFLVNNASGFLRTPFQTMKAEDWQEMLDINVTAPMRCIQLSQGMGLCSVVNLLDIAAWQPWKEFSAYGVSKAGLLHLTRVLARELAPLVRVNAVAPGTSLPKEDEPMDTDTTKKILQKIPLSRLADPMDIARAVRFLLEEPYLTGVCLPVDGGQGLR